MALTGLDYFALYRLIEDELPTNSSNLIKAINTRTVTKRMVDTFFTLGAIRVLDTQLTEPPAPTPNEGDSYLIANTGATGAWAGQGSDNPGGRSR